MAQINSHPNIILIMSDEHDPGVMGCYGDPVDPTPNLDRLAAHGVLFENCYTTCPLCVPARLSFTSGQYISRTGAWNNNCWLPSDDCHSVARELNAAGYRSYLCGKMHYDATRRYGFEEVFPYCGNTAIKTGAGRPLDLSQLKVNTGQWAERAESFRTVPDEEPFLRDIRTHECDAYITEQAIGFLKEHEADKDPFFLLVGYHAPHFPLDVPESWFEKFRDRVPMPEVPEGYLRSMPPHYRYRNLYHGVTEDIPAEVIKKGRECYWALVAWLDNEIGKLLAVIEASRIAHDTVIIYTSDHGENKGDHGMWWKLSMYDHAARIPLIVHWPHRWPGGQRRREACSLVDLTKTVVALGNGEIPPEWDGDAMLDWLDDPATSWRDLAVSEIYGNGIPGSTMFRQGQYKYVYHVALESGGEPVRELYNMEKDPKEFDNLAGLAQYASLIERMHTALIEETGCTPEEIDRIARKDLKVPYDRTGL